MNIGSPQRRKTREGGEKEIKRTILLLAVVALMAMAMAGPASAQSYNYCWAYDTYYGWY